MISSLENSVVLVYLSSASFAFVCWFTTRAYRSGANPRAAIIEAWTNIAIGFSINYVANLLILPLIGVQISHTDNFLIGWIYTGISVMRQYAIRRWFQRHPATSISAPQETA